MDTVLALGLLSLGMFLMVVVTGLVYITSIRPRLLKEDEEISPAQFNVPPAEASNMLNLREMGAGGDVSSIQEELQQKLQQLLITLESRQEQTSAQETQLMLLAQQINAHLDQQTRQINDMTLQLNTELHTQDATLSSIVSRLESQSGIRSGGAPAENTEAAGLMQRLTDLSEQVNQLATTLMNQDELVRQIHAQIAAADGSEPLYIIMGRQGILIKELSEKLAGFDVRLSSAAPADLSGFNTEIDAYSASIQELKKQLAEQQTTISQSLQAFASDRSLTAISGALREQAEKIGKLDARIDEQNDALTQTIQSTGEQKGILENITSQLRELVPDIDQISKRKTRVIRQPNRLTDIKGIGPVYAGMLHEAGIQSFKQLASFTPAQLKDLIDAPGWRGINAESWIEQAKLLADIAEKVEADN